MAPSKFVRAVPALVVAAVLAGAGLARVATPTYYPDDPLSADDDMALDASAVVAKEDANSYDFLVNTMSSPGERSDVRARNVNTVDQVPDSSWFQNRAGRGATTADLVRGPDRLASISLDGWVVSGGKSSGVQPGFRMTDPQGQLYQIEFDPPANPEMASGAEIIGTAFYHAFGYHVVEVYLAELDPSKLVLSDKATVFDPRLGRRRPLSRRDVDNVLSRGARLPNGNYRVLVSRFASGKPLGNFRYYGTRPDDPNDIVPHEHRRELRGARVFAAWLNHDDSRGVNSLDMLETAGDRRYVKHYMFDFGSILGSGTVYAQRHRAGNEYILEWKPGWLTLATLGLYTRPWMHIDYPGRHAAGGRPPRGHRVRPGAVEAGVPQPGVRQHARRRRVLGGRDRRHPRRRVDPRRRREGALQRSEGHRLHDRRADAAPREGAAAVADGGQPGDRRRAGRHRHAHLRQRRRAGRRRHAGPGLHRAVGAVRQRHREWPRR